MIRAAFLALVLVALAALGGCGSGGNDGKAPSPTPNAAPATHRAVAEATAPSCPPAPALAKGPDFADPHNLFGKGAKAFTELETNFATAYASACSGGYFAKQPLIPPGTPHGDTLFLHNAPDANDVAIYLEPNEGDRRSDMLLEYYFITSDGEAHVPGADALKEAIYCETVGATGQEQEDSGRCLVD